MVGLIRCCSCLFQVLIDKLDSVEDTKGNNGDRGMIKCRCNKLVVSVARSFSYPYCSMLLKISLAGRVLY